MTSERQEFGILLSSLMRIGVDKKLNCFTIHHVYDIIYKKVIYLEVNEIGWPENSPLRKCYLNWVRQYRKNARLIGTG